MAVEIQVESSCLKSRGEVLQAWQERWVRVERHQRRENMSHGFLSLGKGSVRLHVNFIDRVVAHNDQPIGHGDRRESLLKPLELHRAILQYSGEKMKVAAAHSGRL